MGKKLITKVYIYKKQTKIPSIDKLKVPYVKNPTKTKPKATCSVKVKKIYSSDLRAKEKWGKILYQVKKPHCTAHISLQTTTKRCENQNYKKQTQLVGSTKEELNVLL